MNERMSEMDGGKEEEDRREWADGIRPICICPRMAVGGWDGCIGGKDRNKGGMKIRMGANTPTMCMDPGYS